MSSKKGYIDNKKFLELLIEFQEINDDTSEWYERIRDKNNDFKELKKRKRNERIQMLATESHEEKLQRQKRLDEVKNELGNHFLLIANGLLKQPQIVRCVS